MHLHHVSLFLSLLLCSSLFACGLEGEVGSTQTSDERSGFAKSGCDKAPSGANAPLVSEGNCGLLYAKYKARGESTARNRLPDFSFAGYGGGGVRIPVLRVVKTVSPGKGDDHAMLQAALDEVAQRTRDANGFRGALLLKRGRYQLAKALKIPADGIVLRGEGQGLNGTILVATARKAYNLIEVRGSTTVKEIAGTRTRISSDWVPVGARSFRVASAKAFSVGDVVVVLRTPNQKWIDQLGMDRFGWTPAKYKVAHERTITGIDGSRITVDIPMTDSLKKQHGGGHLYRSKTSRRQRVGIEDLRMVSDYADGTDEEHGWSAIKLEGVENSWVQRITVRFFAYSAVYVGRSRFVTVQDAAHRDFRSRIEGGRRYPFAVSASSSVLFQRLYVRGGRHNFVSHAQTDGPNVWLDAFAEDNHSDDGPHHRWATGLLFDNTNSDRLNVQNREDSGTGHGWAGAQVMFYNAKANSVICDAPYGAMNWVIGGSGAKAQGKWAPKEPSGIWQMHGLRVAPRSLYLAQLRDRLGDDAVKAVTLPRQRSGTIWAALKSWAGEGRLDEVMLSLADPSCKHGVKSADGKTCCAASCGTCGGKGCSKRPGGADACCQSHIAESDVSCTGDEAPCIIEGDPLCLSGVLSGSGRVCCKASCGTCGGTGCSRRPGGSSGCCIGSISAKQVSCSSRVAPCVL